MKNKKRYTQWEERSLVKIFVNELFNKSQCIFTYTDLDSSQRVFRSGFDFLISANYSTMFFEAKRSIEKQCKNIAKYLTSYQKFTAFEMAIAKVPFYIIEFIIPENFKLFTFVKPDLVEVQLYNVILQKNKRLKEIKFETVFNNSIPFDRVVNWLLNELENDRK